MIRGDFAFDGELRATLFDEMPDLEELLMNLVVDLTLFRSLGEQIHRRQEIVRQLDLTFHRLLRLAHRRPRNRFRRTRCLDRRAAARRRGRRDVWRVEKQRILEWLEVLEVDRNGTRGRLRLAIELERIRRLLLRKRFSGFAKIGLRDFANLKTPCALNLAHDRTRARTHARTRAWLRRSGSAGNETELRRIEMLPHERVLHLLLAAALGEARPIHREPAAEAREPAMNRDEDRGETDSRREQQTDEQRGHERDHGTAGVEVSADGSIDLLAEVPAGGDQ